MLQHVYERVSLARYLTNVIIATDDQRIVEEVRRFGGLARMTRADHLSGTDRVAEVASSDAAEWIVNVQGDEPEIEPEIVDELVERLEQLRALENGHKIRVVETEYESVGVDTPADLEKVTKLFETSLAGVIQNG